MNLSDFSLLKEDSDSYHIGHPNGKSMKIDKKGMSAKAHEVIKKLSKGGSVQKFSDGGAALPIVGKSSDYDPSLGDKISDNINNSYNLANAAAHGDPEAQKQFTNDQIAAVAGSVRATPTGRLLGTVEPEIAGSRQAIQSSLRSQAKQQGLEFGSQRAIAKIPNPGTADIIPAEKPIDIIDRVKARFGDDISDQAWDKMQNQAVKQNVPYVPIVVKGKHAGFLPNMQATPTGMIGNPADFSSGDSSKIFKKDPFGWFDQKYGASKKLLEQHSAAGIPAHITTASDLIAHDDYVNALPDNSHVNLVLTHPLDGDFEMGRAQPSNKRMLTAYDKLKQQGVSASILIPDPANKSLKPLDPFTIKKLQNKLEATWSAGE